MVELSKNSISKVIKAGKAEQIFNPPLVLRLVGFQKVANKASGVVNYIAEVSDGFVKKAALIHPDYYSIFDEGRIQLKSIIEVSSIGVRNTGNSSMLVLREFWVYKEDKAYEFPVEENAEAEAEEQHEEAPSNGHSAKNGKETPVHQEQAAPASIPQNLTSTPADLGVTAIGSLTPKDKKYTILGRVSQIGKIIEYSNAKGKGKLFSFTIIDQSGEIRATCFHTEVDKFFDSVKLDKVYHLSGAKVVPARKEYTNLEHDFELTFSSLTNLIPADEYDSKIPKHYYNFKTIEEIQKLENGATADVVAIVNRAFDPSYITTKDGNEVEKCDIELVDSTGKTIKVTLWDHHAGAHIFEGYPVIACKGLKVRTYKEKNSLSASKSSTIELNPESKETYDLKEWYSSPGRVIESSSGPKKPYVNPRTIITELGDIKGIELDKDAKPKYLNVAGNICYIPTKSMYYPSCQNEGCNKKVANTENDEWHCPTCDETFEAPNYRYILNAKIEDRTDELWVTLFDEMATEIFQKTANDLNDIVESDTDLLNQALEEIYQQDYLFKVVVKSETYQGETRTKAVLQSATPLEDVDQAAEVLAQMNLY
ncbi:replication factor-a protein [Conidiobolus coronatus NRRL 28638]|uniref:Replication protein A subunit n=1 Tax=Conidiobolus coronatus (strain ATCC 28846 / CBS 209.66 / NRRL 28638) TaxID=796925 RepID=A0A137PFA8_CONC2|nr:replication factor-a protein [Conidiobolus coronatus NRRL 28638]|eukprot:KXN73660.1 replication factor-a protein [Conidiobolus coronatus NRRL 28638]